MINVAEILLDPDLCSAFTIQRNPGQYINGGWEATGSTVISAYGAVRNATGREMEMVPEANRVHEMISFRSVTPLYMTNEALSITSDILTYHGQKYIVVWSKNYSDQGYWLAMAKRLKGA